MKETGKNSGALVALEFSIFLNYTPDFSLGVLFYSQRQSRAAGTHGAAGGRLRVRFKYQNCK